MTLFYSVWSLIVQTDSYGVWCKNISQNSALKAWTVLTNYHIGKDIVYHKTWSELNGGAKRLD